MKKNFISIASNDDQCYVILIGNEKIDVKDNKLDYD